MRAPASIHARRRLDFPASLFAIVAALIGDRARQLVRDHPQTLDVQYMIDLDLRDHPQLAAGWVEGAAPLPLA